LTLPAGFEVLEPFVTTWAKDSAAERDGLRTHQSAEARRAFYDAMNPLIVPALDHLDTKSFSEYDTSEKQLMLLALSYAHVALAIEVQGPDEAKHGTNRQRVPISRAPADQH
jgi:hypothetical protein